MNKSILAMAVLAASGAANAANLTIFGGTTEVAPSDNDFVAGESYNIGGNLGLDIDAVDLTFTYLGHEAGYRNQFRWAGSEILHNKDDSVGDSVSVGPVSAGLLDFSFYSENVSSGVINAGNYGVGSAQSFAIMLDYTFGGTFYDAVLLWDDSGAGPDDNHDDMLIGLTASFSRTTGNEVPLPASAWLFMSALVGLSGMARRRVDSVAE